MVSVAIPLAVQGEMLRWLRNFGQLAELGLLLGRTGLNDWQASAAERSANITVKSGRPGHPK
jgi:hypothetical protein